MRCRNKGGAVRQRRGMLGCHVIIFGYSFDVAVVARGVLELWLVCHDNDDSSTSHLWSDES